MSTGTDTVTKRTSGEQTGKALTHRDGQTHRHLIGVAFEWELPIVYTYGMTENLTLVISSMSRPVLREDRAREEATAPMLG